MKLLAARREGIRFESSLGHEINIASLGEEKQSVRMTPVSGEEWRVEM